MRSMLIALSLCFAALSACADDVDGGPCTYKDYGGICTGTADNTFTFVGLVGANQRTFANNNLREAGTLVEGESMSCELQFIETGTCTPCMFDIGFCGEAAFQAYTSPLP